MVVHPFNENFDEGSDAYRKFENRKLHFVFIAVNGLTNFNVIGLNFFTNAELQNFCDTVNAKRETGTLYPIPISILPVGDGDIRERGERKKLMATYIKDAFKANQDHLKCPEILFAFEENQFDCELACEVLIEIANDIPEEQTICWHCSN